MKLTLEDPVTYGEKEITTVTELTFREKMCAGDMRGILIRAEMSFDDALKIAGRLTGQPDIVMNRLSMRDFQKVNGLIAGFMSPGPTIGTTPSE